MIKTELGGRPTENTLRLFLLLAERKGGGTLSDIERVLKLSNATVARAVTYWTDKDLVAKGAQLRDVRLWVSITWEGRAFYRRLKHAMETGTIPPPEPEPLESDEETEIEPWIKEWMESDEYKEHQRKEEAKRAREEAKRQEWLAQQEERRRNPKTPIDAYRNWMETCPHPSGSKKRKEWKRDNPLVFNGVTYVDQWSPQLSNSGKTTRWAGWLTGSDGSHHTITDEHINNRRNDPNRNWGLPE